MGRIKFVFKTTDDAGAGYLGRYGRYGFVISISRVGYSVVWNVDGKYPLIPHEKNPFPSLISAGQACEELLDSLLKKGS